jgi:hypothetical protein
MFSCSMTLFLLALGILLEFQRDYINFYMIKSLNCFVDILTLIVVGGKQDYKFFFKEHML